MKREIRAIKMFLPVVIVYFMTNIGPIVNYVLIHFQRRTYREMYQVMFISIAFNSVANLPIYCWSSSVFKAEFKEMVGKLEGPKNRDELNMRCNTEKTSGNTSVSSSASNMY